MLQCPVWNLEKSQEPAYFTPYLGIAGLGLDAPSLPVKEPRAGVFGYDRRTSIADIKDGTSNTVMILESTSELGPWSGGGPATMRGLNSADHPYLGTGRPFGGTHFAENSVSSHGRSIGCKAAMADGSVHFLSESIAPNVLEALVTIAGGEKIVADW